jgi:hypothetical protein
MSWRSLFGISEISAFPEKVSNKKNNKAHFNISFNLYIFLYFDILFLCLIIVMIFLSGIDVHFPHIGVSGMTLVNVEFS